MFSLLPTEILYHCICYLNDASNKKLSQTNKQFNILLNKQGFLTSMTFDAHDDISMFANDIARHHKTLKHITYNHANDPLMWIPKWSCKNITFNRCFFNHCNLNPPIPTSVEQLQFRNCHYKRNMNMKINWKKFPKLKEVICINEK